MSFIKLKLFLKGWRKCEMPKWVEDSYYKKLKKNLPYGKTLFFKGDKFTYRVYTGFPQYQGHSGDKFVYRKLNN